MTNRYSLALCDCGEPATPSSIQSGKRRCIECSNRAVAQAAREMHAKSGPAYDAWLASSGPDGFAHARQSPRTAPARLRNIAKAQAANARRRAAEVTADSGVSVLEPAPVPAPSGPLAVPAAVFLPPR